jgi:hypothetical protein
MTKFIKIFIIENRKKMKMLNENEDIRLNTSRIKKINEKIAALSKDPRMNPKIVQQIFKG